MSDNDKFLTVVLAIAFAVLILLGGIAIGSDGGRNDIANDWCVSLGYDTGEYDRSAENIVCKYVETLEIERGE